MVTELGHENTERIHLHGIIFGGEKSEIERIWKYGHVKFGDYVNLKTVNYIVKYINKVDLDHKGYVSKILTSAGIGKNYINRVDKRLNKYIGKNTDMTYKSNNGYKMAQPIYYRNKIWTDEEREKLWLHMLDKNERYIMGEKIDISDGDNDYYAILEEAREKNKRLGYGDDSKDWSKEEYQKKRTAFHANRNFVLNKIKKLNKVNKKSNTEKDEIHLLPIRRDWNEDNF